MKTVTNSQAPRMIEKRLDFKNHGDYFRGLGKSNGSFTTHPGWLPDAFHESMRAADYIVYSFKTPIGWHVPDHGWVVPEVTFSQRTNRHQGILRGAIWNEIVLRPSWQVIPDSQTAAAMLRSIREGVNVDIRTRTKRIVDLVVATGEAHVVTKDGLTYLTPA